MMRTIGRVTITIAASVLSAACAVRVHQGSTEQEVIAAQQALITANNAADVATLEQLTADDYVGIDANGVSRTKSQLRAATTARGPARIQATPEQLAERQRDWRVRGYDDIGIVTRLTAGDHGARQWITTVWERRDGRWRRVFSQVTNVP